VKKISWAILGLCIHRHWRCSRREIDWRSVSKDMVYVHSNLRLLDKISAVDYKNRGGVGTAWEHGLWLTQSQRTTRNTANV